MRYLPLALWLIACGDTAPTVRDDGGFDAALDGGVFDAGSVEAGLDAGSDAGHNGGVDAGPLPPMNVQPCETGSCYSDLSLPLMACGRALHTEDYASGRYNVHAYATRVLRDADTVLSVQRTAGMFSPALVLHDSDGRTISDGELGRDEPGLRVTVEESGETGDEARVRIASDVDRMLTLYVSDWAVLESGFTTFLPTDVTYQASAESECDTPGGCVVAGNTVDEPACGWLRFISTRVVPFLEGTREEKLGTGARVAWWALKEGVLFLENPIIYSNCNFPEGDMRIGPLEICGGGRAWQVGLSAIQVPTFELSRVEATAARLYPERTIESLLEQTAADAALDPTQTAAVVSSTGDLRRAWLLRESAIGFTLQISRVTAECIDDSRAWCYGTGWTATRLFSPDRATALRAIADIRAMFDAALP